MHNRRNPPLSLLLVISTVVMGALALTPSSRAAAPPLASTERTMLLYVSALEAYQEGRYADTIGTLEELLSLPRARSVQFDDSSLQAFIEKSRRRLEEWKEARTAFDARDYMRAEFLLRSLTKESPSSAEIADYLNKTQAFKAKEAGRLEQERKLAEEQEQKRQQEMVRQEESRRRQDELARQKLLLDQERLRQQQALDEERRLAAERKEAERLKRLEEDRRAKSALEEQKRKKEEERHAAELARLEAERRRIEELKARRDKDAQERAHAEQLRLQEAARQKQDQAKRQEEMRLKREEERRLAEVNERAQREAAQQRRDEERALKKKIQDEELAAKKQKEQEGLARIRAQADARQLKAAEENARREQEREAVRMRRLEEERLRLDALRKTREAEYIRLQEERRMKEQRLADEKARMELVRQQERQRAQAELERRRQELTVKEDLIRQEQSRKRELEQKERELARQQRMQELEAEKEERLRALTEERKHKESQITAAQGALEARRAELARERERKDEQARLQREQQEAQRRSAEARPGSSALARGSRAAAQAVPPVSAAPKSPPSVAPVSSEATARTAVQEQMMQSAHMKKQQEDQAKIEKVERLWKEALRLYRSGMYELAIKDFQDIIAIEGNPRIKYTPYAKDYIEKAEQKLEEEKSTALEHKVEDVEKEMIGEVQDRQIPPYVEPPEVTEEAQATLLIEPPAIRKKLKKKINLDFDKVDLKSVALFLSEESGVNFVISQKVLDLTPKVSVRFTDVPVDEVIKYITKSLGLIYRFDNEIVWIAHPEEIAQEALETRVYYLSHGGGLFTEFSPMSSSTETGLGGSSAQINKVTTIEDTLREVVPWPGEAKLTYDKRLNALIVRNTPQNLQMLEDILYTLDITPCQVLIEARFLEVDITDTKELGLTWKFTDDFPADKANGNFVHGVGENSGVDFSDFARLAEGMNFTYKGVLTTPQFETVLHALEENKKIKTLSAPRITTLNNQAATIKVVDEWIYPTRYEFEIVQFDSNGDGDFNDAGETQYKNVPKDFLRRDVGILLKVIPAVGADKKTISLSLIPEVSEAAADGFSYAGEVTLPKFTSRNLSTTVVVDSGETVVLGGLIKESRTKTATKVPVLGDIPFVGALFRKDSDSIQRKNLIIFVTARVLTSSGEEIVVRKTVEKK